MIKFRREIRIKIVLNVVAIAIFFSSGPARAESAPASQLNFPQNIHSLTDDAVCDDMTDGTVTIAK